MSQGVLVPNRDSFLDMLGSSNAKAAFSLEDAPEQGYADKLTAHYQELNDITETQAGKSRRKRSFLTKIWDWLKKLFKKILKIFAKLLSKFKWLAVIAIIFAIMCPTLIPLLAGYFGASAATVASLTTVSTTIGALGMYGQAALAGVTCLVLFPKETKQLVNKATDIASDVGEAMIDVSGHAVKGIISSIWATTPGKIAIVGGLGLLGYLIYSWID